jgi:simple sugar transport system permease protein
MDRLFSTPRSYEAWLLIATVSACVVLSLVNPVFFSLRNAQDLLTSNAFTAILAAGLLIVLISGGIDISFTATATVAQYLAFSVALSYDIGWLGVIAIVSATGIALGLVNAVLIDRFRIPSIIATLATLNVFYGLLVFITRGEYIYTLPAWFSATFSLYEYQGSDGVYYALNLQIVATVLVFLLTWFILRRTMLGQRIRAFGGNPQAARRIGIPISRIQLFVYCWMGLCAGIASLVQAQLAQSIVPTALVGRELDVLAAVVLGGTSLQGGKGTVGGTILGLIMLSVIQSGIVLSGISSYWSQFVTGAIIIVAISATAIRSQKRVGA